MSAMSKQVHLKMWRLLGLLMQNSPTTNSTHFFVKIKMFFFLKIIIFSYCSMANPTRYNLDYSPPHEIYEVAEGSCRFLASFLQSEKMQSCILDLTIVRSNGPKDTHPHLHCVFKTTRRTDSIRRSVLTKLTSKFDLTNAVDGVMIRIRRTYNVSATYSYLIKNLDEPHGELIVASKEFNTFRVNISQSIKLPSIKRETLLGLCLKEMKYHKDGHFTKHMFNRMMTAIAQDYDITPHMRYLKPIYLQCQCAVYDNDEEEPPVIEFLTDRD